jgi:hypothetical protein
MSLVQLQAVSLDDGAAPGDLAAFERFNICPE